MTDPLTPAPGTIWQLPERPATPRAPLCFVDTETTGVHPDREIWEVAMVRRDFLAGTSQETTEVEVTAFLEVDLSDADAYGLKVGGFYERHPLGRWLASTPDPDVDKNLMTAPTEGIDFSDDVARVVARMTHGAHLVGVNPAFDAESLADLLRRHDLTPAWDYHLIDLGSMALGYLNGLAQFDGHECRDGVRTWSEETAFDGPPAPPWRSDDLARACGVQPATEEERHTALGDVRWAMRWYDAMTGGAS